MSLAPGTRLGVYQIVAPLGAGGMGEVFRARDTKLNRDVAIKILPDLFLSDPERVARFTREAQTLAALNHPHIAQIYGIEEGTMEGGAAAPAEAGAFYRALVMELVEGEDLSQRLARGPIPLDEALPIARQIAEGLEAAHEQGIIHRDLKPGNVKVRPDGTVKVLDFGLAKIADPGAAGASGARGARGARGADALNSPTITTPAMTMQGVILGTAAYMSPEQAKGRIADHRSDVWAFGCVLYEMLTGRRVFEGEDVSDTLAAVLRGEPEYAALPADTPPAVRTLIKRCLERDRRRRVASLSTALFVIDEATSLTTSSPPARSTQADEAALRTRVETAVSEARRALMLRRVLPAMAALAVIVVSGAIVAWWFRAVDVPPIVTRFSIPVRQGVLALGRPVLAISNDGSSLAYAANRELFLRLVSDFSVRAIQAGDVGSGVIHSLVFSPDDRALAFFSDGDIRRVNIGGGGAVTVCSARQPWGMTWHATGLIVGQGPFGIVRCHANGGSPEPLVKVGEGELAHGPQILPGDDALLFTLAKTSNGASLWDSAEIVVQSLTTGERKTIVRGGSDARYLPTGHLVYAVGGVVLAAPFDARRREVSGSAVPVIEGVRRSIGTTGSAHFVTSLTGSLMYVPGPTGLMSAAWALATSDRAGTPTRLAIPPGPYVHVRASRDGTHLAVGSDTGSEAIVWIHRLAGDSAMRRLTLTGRNRFPTWLPDGQRVAFQSDREGDAGIFVQRIDGTGGAERLTKAATGEAHVPEAWSPDGRYLLFSVTKESSYALWMYSAADKTVRPFGGVQSREPTGAVFSADGRWVAYASTPVEGGTRSPNRGIFVQPFPPTGDTYQVPPEIFDFHPAWSPTSMDLIYIPAAASGDISVVRMTTTGGVTFSSPTRSPALLTAQRTSNLARVWDTLPDGRFVGLVSPVSDAGADASELRVVINWFEELKQRVPRGR